MRPLRLRLGRVVIAVAAVVGQFIPAPIVWACGDECCSASTSRSCCTRNPSAEQEPDSPCPLCGAERSERRPAAPCRCHLKARHDPATKLDGCVPLDLHDTGGCTVGRVANDDGAETTGELVRAALAAGEMIPYRPPRIVCGVWRN